MTTMTQKKKKGRPSLLDLQKRALKQQQQEDQSQVQRHRKNPDCPDFISDHNQRSTHRNPNVTSTSPEWSTHDDEDERKEKKLKPLTGFNSNSIRHVQYPTLSAKSNLSTFNSGLCGSDSNVDGDDPELAKKKRNISAVHFGSNYTSQKDLKGTDCSIQGSQVDFGPTTTPLPDKKLLVFILDRVQKKDTYGVFSEPVDREELPDYHDIIENPMDFSTVRKKLDGGAYVSLEDFEKDVFLICSNAMQYNEPDTIYFRQARSMQELARKDFENLRQDSDDSDPQPKVVRRGRPPGKSLKKPIDKFPIDTPASLGDAALASGGDSSGRSNAYNLRKCTLSRFRNADSSNGIPGGSLNGEACMSRLTEWESEFPASVARNVLKFGKKQFSLDENRRDTYRHPLASGHGSSIWAAHEGQWRQLMPVGLFLEQDYARSLARFAADLGPVAWKVASKKVESILPGGLKFSPGLISANKGLNQHQSEEKYFSGSPGVKLTNWFPSQSATGSSSAVSGLKSQHKLVLVNSDASGIKHVPLIRAQQHSNIHFGMNVLNNGIPSHTLPQMGMSEPATLVGKSWSADDIARSHMGGMASIGSNITCPATKNDINSNETTLSLAAAHQSLGPEFHNRAIELDGNVSWQGFSMQHKNNAYSFPTDLNITVQGVGLPDSGAQICSPQQPDLALQL